MFMNGLVLVLLWLSERSWCWWRDSCLHFRCANHLDFSFIQIPAAGIIFLFIPFCHVCKASERKKILMEERD